MSTKQKYRHRQNQLMMIKASPEQDNFFCGAHYSADQIAESWLAMHEALVMFKQFYAMRTGQQLTPLLAQEMKDFTHSNEALRISDAYLKGASNAFF